VTERGGGQGDVTADELESLVRAALNAGDAEGVQAALVALSVVDPVRASNLLDTLKITLDLDLGSRVEGD
jgi:hypothetical protein